MITPRTDPIIWLSLMISFACAALAARYHYRGRHGVIRRYAAASCAGGRPCLADVVRRGWLTDPR